MATVAIFFPFDLFGSSGTAAGADLLAEAFAEMLADNRSEKLPTRAAVYQPHVKQRVISFETIDEVRTWRQRGRRLARTVWQRGDFLLWTTGNHLGALPLYDELTERAADTVVIQLDAHLDIYNLADCTTELSHGNFLLHARQPLPRLINVGSRELLLTPGYVQQYYQQVFPAVDVLTNPELALGAVRQACSRAKWVFLDLDCDVFDPAYFPAVTHPLPFGLAPGLVLRFLEAAWSERVVGLSVSEFDPARDQRDISLGTLLWLKEYLLLKQYGAAAY